MKLYKYYNEESSYYGTDKTVHYGYIDERKMDDFNGKIKVFIPVAMESIGRVHMWGEGRDIDLYDFDEMKSRYISQLPSLEECTSKERKAVFIELRQAAADHRKTADKFTSLIKKLGSEG